MLWRAEGAKDAEEPTTWPGAIKLLCFLPPLARLPSTTTMQSYELHAQVNTEPRRAPIQRTEPKRWILNAFDMSTAGHQSPGLWKHPKDRSAEYHSIEYWTDLAKILEKGKFNGVFSESLQAESCSSCIRLSPERSLIFCPQSPQSPTRSAPTTFTAVPPAMDSLLLLVQVPNGVWMILCS